MKRLSTLYSYFGARYYDSDLSVWLSVDPLSDKYPSLSPFMYCAGNPVMLVDPDGMKIRGYSIDDDGNVVEDDRASKRAQRIYHGMKQTPEGLERFKAMVSSPTKVRLSITKNKLFDDDGSGAQIRAKTYGRRYNEKTGLYRRALVVFSTASIEGDRFQYAENQDNIFNVSGVHESWHAVDKEQISIDRSDRGGSWSGEATNILSELRSWIQWSNKFTGDYRYMPNYNKPDPSNILYGEPKPGFYSSEKIHPPKKRPIPYWYFR